MIGLDLSCNALTTLDLTRFDPFVSTLTYLDISGNSFTAPPTDAALQAKLTHADLSLHTGINTACLPPYEFGLSSISLSTGTLVPAFQAPGTDVYTVRIGHDVSSLTVTVTPTDPRATIEPRGDPYLYDNDENAPGIQVDLAPTRTNIGWQVRIRNGAFAVPTQLAVYRDHPPATNALLQSLELSSITLGSTFDGRTQTYTATAATGVTETTVTATPLDPDATVVIKLNGVTDADGTVGLAVGDNVITVEVTAEDGTTMQTYTATVTRAASADATLRSLSLSGVTLAPSFIPGTISYTGSVANSVSSTSVTATTTHPGATAVVKLGGVTDTDGTVNLAVGDNVITVEVTAEDGTTMQTYTVTVTRASLSADATLRSLSLSRVTLDPSFIPGTTSYTGSVASSVTSTTVTAATTRDGATAVVKLGGVTDADGTVDLAPGDSVITVEVTAEDGTMMRTYTVTVTRPSLSADTTLSSLSLSDVTLSPSFASDTTFYTATAPASAYETIVTATPSAPGATVLVTLTKGRSVTHANPDGTVPLAPGDYNNIITVLVTAANERTNRSYSILVGRGASADTTLRSLSLSGVTLSPSFASDTTSYTGSVANSVTSTMVAAATTHTGARAVVKLGNVTDTDGTVDLVDGDNVIKVEVTAENGSTMQTYTVTVTVTVTGLTVTPTSLIVDEGGTNTYTVKLLTQPTTAVTVTVRSDDTGAATVNRSTLTFTTSNWDTEQTVTVRGVDDNDSANETVTVTNTASGGEYAGVTASVTVTVDDNDKPGITFTPAARTIREGATGTYDVKLNAAPSPDTAEVTVAISSDNPDVTVMPNSLTFTAANYASNQRVTVTIAQDADAADDTANLAHRPSGGGYSNNESKDFVVTVTDDDTAGLTVTPNSLTIGEGSTGTYTVKLATQPTTTVTVAVSSDDTGAATVSGSTLTFTTSNWDTAQTVTVRGVDDSDSTDETVTITNTASGGEYAGVTASVTVTVYDDDKPGICGRTQVVQDAILAALTGSPTCEAVTDTQLASVTYLEISRYPHSSVLPADFAGLTGLTSLIFFFSTALTTVPDDAFADLTSLETLIVSLVTSKLTTLGADAFAGLTNLTTLNLTANSLTTLDEDIFDGLTALASLDLSGNSLRTLDADIFDGLTNLGML